MSVSTIDRPVSALRQRMLDDMAMSGLRSDTQRDYIRVVRSFATFLGRSPDTATAEDIRRFQVHQHESGVQPPTINCSVSALRFFFTVTPSETNLNKSRARSMKTQRLPPSSYVIPMGGDARAGYRVGEMFRSRGLRTAVSGYCYSSCSRMFLGGAIRVFTDDFPPEYTNVGFHGHYDGDGRLDAKLVRLLGLKD